MGLVTKQKLRDTVRDNRFLRPLRFARLNFRARFFGHPDWQRILSQDAKSWSEARDKASGGPSVLMATGVGLHFPATRLDSLLGVALTLRGARVTNLLCDEFLPACMAANQNWYPDTAEFVRDGGLDKICNSCFKPAQRMYEELGLETISYGGYVSEDRRQDIEAEARDISAEDIEHHVVDGIVVGEHAIAGTLRFFARGTLESAPGWEAVLRQFLRAALLTEAAMSEIFRQGGYQVCVVHHGIYVPQGIVCAVARREGVNVVTWNPAYRRKCFIFSHGDSYHHTLMDEPVSEWADLELTADQETEILDYLESRKVGSADWISFHRQPLFDSNRIDEEFGLTPDRPRIGLLTNVFWDAQLHYPTNVFPTMRDWLIETVEHFIGRPELQLIIRVHPAEITGLLPSKEPVVKMLGDAFPELPENIVVVPPDHPASTYTLMEKCNAAIIFGTKAGIELTTNGYPVIVAGEAWIRNKGITLDPADRDEYFRLLDRLPFSDRDYAVDVARARKFAYHFFFRRMIPVMSVKPVQGWPPYKIEDLRLADLEPGRDPGLDIICDGILKGSKFTYPAEINPPTSTSND